MVKVMIMDPPDVDRREILRYMGAKAEDPALAALIDECLAEAEAALEHRVCYTIETICRDDDIMRFGNIESGSATLSRALSGCNEVLIFAATVGVGLDRLLSRYSHTMPSKALVMQAIGTERIESLCDVFCEQMKSFALLKDKSLRPRVSPGYGDISLKLQRDLFILLDCPRKIGLTLNEQLLMSPSKSVTAFAGISSEQCAKHSKNKCSSCTKQDCMFRIE